MLKIWNSIGFEGTRVAFGMCVLVSMQVAIKFFQIRNSKFKIKWVHMIEHTDSMYYISILLKKTMSWTCEHFFFYIFPRAPSKYSRVFQMMCIQIIFDEPLMCCCQWELVIFPHTFDCFNPFCDCNVVAHSSLFFSNGKY